MQLNLPSGLGLNQQAEIKVVHENEVYQSRPIIGCKCHAGEGNESPFEVVQSTDFASVPVKGLDGHYSTTIQCIGASVSSLRLKFPTYSSCPAASKSFNDANAVGKPRGDAHHPSSKKFILWNLHLDHIDSDRMTAIQFCFRQWQ